VLVDLSLRHTLLAVEGDGAGGGEGSSPSVRGGLFFHGAVGALAVRCRRGRVHGDVVDGDTLPNQRETC